MYKKQEIICAILLGISTVILHNEAIKCWNKHNNLLKPIKEIG